MVLVENRSLDLIKNRFSASLLVSDWHCPAFRASYAGR